MKKYLTWKEKQQIVVEAYKIERNINATARAYNVDTAQIRRWKKQLSSLWTENGVVHDENKQNHILRLKMVQKGRPRRDADKYGELKEYYMRLRSMDRVVTVRMLCFELKRMNPDMDIDAKVLRKRIYRWLNAEHIVQRRVTHVAQNTRYNVETINDFVHYINDQIVTGGFDADQIVNIDETNIEFDMVGSITLANRGTRTVSIRSSGSSSRCTVLLGVTLSGKKLPPFIIFKGMPNGRIAREWTGQTVYPSSCVYAVQQKAWIDERTFLEWITKIWKPFCHDKQSSYLLMDECTVHLMGTCLDAIQDQGTEVDFIVRGYTSKLQACDVGVNKPFKEYVKQSYEEFMITEGGRKSKRLDVATWVANAWEKITTDSIRRTWESIGIVANNA